jgi:hypothetical protein
MLSKDGAHLVLGRWEGNSGRRNQTHDQDTLLPARLLSLADGAIRIAFGDCSGAFLQSPVWFTLVVAMRSDFGLCLRLYPLSEIDESFRQSCLVAIETRLDPSA